MQQGYGDDLDPEYIVGQSRSQHYTEDGSCIKSLCAMASATHA